MDSTYSLSREISDCLTCILYVFEKEGLALLSEFEFVVLARAGSFPLLYSPSRINKLNRDIRVRKVDSLLDYCRLVQIKIQQFAFARQMH